MATKLKNMKLTSVDLVKAGANQKADIRLYKSADGTATQEEAEKGIFKRFLNWLYEATASDEAVAGMNTPIEKGDDPETANIYKSAITESIQSIIADESLSAEEKNDMVEKSLEQYHEKMLELTKSEPQKEEPEQVEMPDTEDDSDDEPQDDPEDIPEPEYDDIEEVENL